MNRLSLLLFAAVGLMFPIGLAASNYTLTSQEVDASWLPRNDPADQTAGRA